MEEQQKRLEGYAVEATLAGCAKGIMAKRYPTPYEDDIEITVGGKTYNGSWMVERGMITVSYGTHSKTTQVGGSASGGEETLAKIMLHELVQEYRRETD